MSETRKRYNLLPMRPITIPCESYQTKTVVIMLDWFHADLCGTQFHAVGEGDEGLSH